MRHTVRAFLTTTMCVYIMIYNTFKGEHRYNRYMSLWKNLDTISMCLHKYTFSIFYRFNNTNNNIYIILYNFVDGLLHT